MTGWHRRHLSHGRRHAPLAEELDRLSQLIDREEPEQLAEGVRHRAAGSLEPHGNPVDEEMALELRGPVRLIPIPHAVQRDRPQAFSQRPRLLPRLQGSVPSGHQNPIDSAGLLQDEDQSAHHPKGDHGKTKQDQDLREGHARTLWGSSVEKVNGGTEVQNAHIANLCAVSPGDPRAPFTVPESELFTRLIWEFIAPRRLGSAQKWYNLNVQTPATAATVRGRDPD